MGAGTIHKGGRPTHYTDEVLDKLADSLFEWVKNNASEGKYFLLSDWCFENGFSPQNFKRYCSKHEYFKDAYEYAKEWQAHYIAKNALYGTFNARFAQFFLSVQHDWKAKDDSDLKGKELRNDFGLFMDHIRNKYEKESEESE